MIFALPASDKRAILQALVGRVDVRPETVEVSVRLAALPDIVKPDLDTARLPGTGEGAVQVLSVPARLKRTGMETRLLIEGAPGAEPPRRPDRSLLRLVAQARRFHDLVMTNDGTPIKALAARAGVSPSYFTRVFRLSFLAPDITRAIIQGRQPPGFSAIKLIMTPCGGCSHCDLRCCRRWASQCAGRLALGWSDQRRQETLVGAVA